MALLFSSSRSGIQCHHNLSQVPQQRRVNMEQFFQSNPITHPVKMERDKDQKEKAPKNDKKPLNRQNSSWYNMSFLDCGYNSHTQAPPPP